MRARVSRHVMAMARARIGTHNGTFHCDEVLACSLLRHLPRYKDAAIVRTRDPELLAACDVVVDVGAEYDPSRHRYDHHQRDFSECMNSLWPSKPWKTKLSSAGLIFLHFGEQVLASILEVSPKDLRLPTLYNKMYEGFVQEIDAIDNGISQHDSEPRYIITTHLSARVSRLNTPWNDSHADTKARFEQALRIVGEEFHERLMHYWSVWLPARSLVSQALQERMEVHNSGEIVCLTSGGCPWKEHLFDLEVELGLSTPIKFVLYLDQNGGWRVQCVPILMHSFQNRLSLPEPWRGLRGESLSQITGIPDCIFVHANGFIGGNAKKEGALAMARAALRLELCADNEGNADKQS
uniref:MYG1 exonuclease isoform X2 n=1 Tax=Myxine glutinosa TaxID=7769 RepID=UPI00358E71CE